MSSVISTSAAKVVGYEQTFTINLNLLSPKGHRMAKESLKSCCSLFENYDTVTSCVNVCGNTFEDVVKGRELLLDVIQIASYNVWPFRAIYTTSILGSAFGLDQAIEFVPYKGPLSYIKESNGSRCGLFVINPTDLDVDKVLAGGRGISNMSTSRMMDSWFTEKFIEEAGMRVAQSLADPGNADGMYFEVSLGKALWAERDPDDEFNKLNGRVMDFMGFSRIQNLGEAVNLVFRPEFDTASKSALVRGLVARGYASSASEKLVRITTIRTGSAEEDVWLCSAHGSDTFLTVDQHFARLRHHHDGTTLNPANTLDARTTIRTTQKTQTLSHVPNAIKKWLVYDPSAGSLAFSNSGYKPSMPNYQVEQIGATVLTSGSIRVRIEHVKSITRDAPAVYKVMFSSAAIDAEIGKGASFNGSKLQEAIQELDAEVKAVTELFILGDDGLKEKGCDSKFSLRAKNVEEMARLMAKKAAKPILKGEPTFEAETVAVLPSAASEMKPVIYMEYQEQTVTEQPIPQVTTTKSPRLASRNDFLAWMVTRNALVNQKSSLKIMNQTVEEDRDGKPAFSEEEEEVKPVEVIQTDGRWNPVGEIEQQRKDEAGGHHIDDRVDEPSEKHAEEEEDDEPVFVTQRYVARRKVSPLLRPTLSGLEESFQQIKSKYSYVGVNQLSRNKIVIEGRWVGDMLRGMMIPAVRKDSNDQEWIDIDDDAEIDQEHSITISEDLIADDFNSQLYEEYESDEYSECSLLGYAYKSTRTGDWSDFAVTDGESEFRENDDVAVACVAQNAVDSN